MASFSFEEFLGNGSLKSLLPRLMEDGWDDVPTLKLMNSDDMKALNMTQEQKEALEIRTYLHDRAIMQYADKLEDSKNCLPDLLNMSYTDLSAKFGMKRGHIARFKDRKRSCAADPGQLRRAATTASRNNSLYRREHSSINSNITKIRTSSLGRRRSASDVSIERSMSELKIKDGHIFKGVVASVPAEPRACGCFQSPLVVEDVAPLSVIEKISVRKLTSPYNFLVKTKPPLIKASELWRDKPAVILCIRRLGCIMCRAEAHQLYSRKPMFDALGVQLFAAIHEYIETEVKDFWPNYWGGVVLHDREMEFFKALGGGKLLRDNFISGFLLNPRAIANYRRAKAMRIEHNFNGEGEIKGGLFIVGKGKQGIAYQFVERNFGDWAPLSEVFEICTRLQNQHPS